MAGHPRIKFCGITNLDDAHAAAEAGAWALGMILWAPSPRACPPADAQAIGSALRRSVELCGVFVNAPLDEVVEAAQAVPLSMVQLHGDEGPAYCAAVAQRTGAKVAKAVRVRSRADLQGLSTFHTDFHLVDAYVPGVRGGTGRTADWALAGRHAGSAPLILSGGLTHENVAAGIEAVRPYAVDVASGTEASPGVKDHAKLAAFAAAVAGTTEAVA